jgi:hypothetical protein
MALYISVMEPKRRCLAVHRLSETPHMRVVVEFSCTTARNGSSHVILARPGRQSGKCRIDRAVADIVPLGGRVRQWLPAVRSVQLSRWCC